MESLSGPKEATRMKNRTGNASHRKRGKWIWVLYFLSILAALFFILSPVLIRIPAVKSLLSSFLQPLGNSTYKTSYISMVSSLLGSFLAITGAIWTQRLLSKLENEKKKKAEAKLVYYELDTAITILKNLLQIVYPRTRGNRLPSVGEAYNSFCNQIRSYPLICDKELRANLMLIRDKLNIEDLQALLQLHTKIQQFSSLTHPLIENRNADDFKIAYQAICSLFEGAAAERNTTNISGELISMYKVALENLYRYVES